MKREWRDVLGFEGQYQVSDDGYVRSLPDIDWRGRFMSGRIMSQAVNEKGYETLVLRGESRRVHRLVAEAFLPKPAPEKNQINHKNGNKRDNRVCNLEWCDNSENQRHRYEVLNHRGAMTGRTGANCKNSKPVVGTCILTREVRRYPGASEAGRQLGIHGSAVAGCASGRTKQAGGWIWVYE